MLEVLRECGALQRLLPETELDVEVNWGQTPIESRLSLTWLLAVVVIRLPCALVRWVRRVRIGRLHEWA